jgi:hypothetical protein
LEQKHAIRYMEAIMDLTSATPTKISCTRAILSGAAFLTEQGKTGRASNPQESHLPGLSAATTVPSRHQETFTNDRLSVSSVFVQPLKIAL